MISAFWEFKLELIHFETCTYVITVITDLQNFKFFDILDVFEYELWNPMALYASIPFMMGHKKE